MRVNCFKILNLETGVVSVYRDRSFCELLEITECNFKNRWRNRTTVGICFFNRFYITEIEIKSK